MGESNSATTQSSPDPKPDRIQLAAWPVGAALTEGQRLAAQRWTKPENTIS